ncbi:MAG: bifunctional oligoribonuclease/PAP phosphatase NrnA [Crocinitomicaceae bacterium]|nr:bifunctional oligoribonuclease/PAP phosphatase NrnA [Crocinitomicaceae bacterium]
MSIYQDIINAIDNATNIVITSHKSPDGDSIGSSLGLYQFIQKMNKNVSICHPDKAPSFFNWLDNFNAIHLYESAPNKVSELITNADLLFCLDYNHLSRVGDEMQVVLEQFNGKKIVIDHHITPSIDAIITLSDTSVCSTCQLIYDIIDYSDKKQLLDVQIATPLYLGIVTDSGSFRFPSVQPRTHEIASEMLKLGVEHYKVHENTFDTNSISKMKLNGYAISEKLEIVHQNKIAIVSLSLEELERFNYQKGDTEGLVNTALSISGIQVAVLVTEQQEQIRLSFRSKGEYAVNIIANEQFNGGGHKYAAGGSSNISLKDTLDKLKSLLPNYFL